MNDDDDDDKCGVDAHSNVSVVLCVLLGPSKSDLGCTLLVKNEIRLPISQLGRCNTFHSISNKDTAA